jgi:hypothetical protein
MERTQQLIYEALHGEPNLLCEGDAIATVIPG